MITSIDYELFIRALHQNLIDEDGFQGVKVEHDVTFIGKSGAKHQIDVCWKLTIAGVEQLFCVECKRWKSSIKKEHISAFYGKLSDLNHAKGIFVTTSEYQEGAIKFAKHNNITLINARIETQQSTATLSFSFPTTEIICIQLDASAPNNNKWIESLWENDPNKLKLVNTQGTQQGSLRELIESISHDDDGEYTQQFGDLYIETPEGPLAMKEIRYRYRQNTISSMTLYSQYETARAVAKYILDDKEISASLHSHRNGK